MAADFAVVLKTKLSDLQDTLLSTVNALVVEHEEREDQQRVLRQKAEKMVEPLRAEVKKLREDLSLLAGIGGDVKPSSNTNILQIDCSDYFQIQIFREELQGVVFEVFNMFFGEFSVNFPNKNGGVGGSEETLIGLRGPNHTSIMHPEIIVNPPCRFLLASLLFGILASLLTRILAPKYCFCSSKIQLCRLYRYKQVQFCIFAGTTE